MGTLIHGFGEADLLADRAKKDENGNSLELGINNSNKIYTIGGRYLQADGYDKVSGATVGNIVTFGNDGTLSDSNKTFADFVDGSSDTYVDYPAISTFVTIGGRDYPYVQIGDYYWTTENLDWHAPGLYVYDGKTEIMPWTAFPDTEPDYMMKRTNYGIYYTDEATNGVNGNKFGLLYSSYAATNMEYPEGWSIPDEEAMSNLTTIARSDSTKLKAKNYWSSDLIGTDDYKFSAFASGYYDTMDSAASVYGYGATKHNDNQYFTMYTMYNNALRVWRIYNSNGIGYATEGWIDGGHSIRLCKHV